MPNDQDLRAEIAAMLPALSPHDHPEPDTLKWSPVELQAIRRYATTAILADRRTAPAQSDLPPYYVSGPYPKDGAMSVCETATGRVLHKFWLGAQPGVAVPDGWKLVPIKPTLRQMASMGPAIRACYKLDGATGDVTGVYAAALDSAPSTTADSVDVQLNDDQIHAAWEADKKRLSHDPRTPSEAFWAGVLFAERHHGIAAMSATPAGKEK